MPIVVAHQPSAIGIGNVAFQSGLGQYRLQQQDQLLRWTQMALADRAQQMNWAMQNRQMDDQNARFAYDRNLDQQRWREQMGANAQWQQNQLAGRVQEQQNLFNQQNAMDERNFAQQQQMEALRFGNAQNLAKAQQQAQFEDWKQRTDYELTTKGAELKKRQDQVFGALDQQVRSGNLAQDVADTYKQRWIATNQLPPADAFRPKVTPQQELEENTVRLENGAEFLRIQKPDGSVGWQEVKQPKIKAIADHVFKSRADDTRAIDQYLTFLSNESLAKDQTLSTAVRAKLDALLNKTPEDYEREARSVIDGPQRTKQQQPKQQQQPAGEGEGIDLSQPVDDLEALKKLPWDQGNAQAFNKFMFIKSQLDQQPDVPKEVQAAINKVRVFLQQNPNAQSAAAAAQASPHIKAQIDAARAIIQQAVLKYGLEAISPQ